MMHNRDVDTASETDSGVDCDAVGHVSPCGSKRPCPDESNHVHAHYPLQESNHLNKRLKTELQKQREESPELKPADGVGFLPLREEKVNSEDSEEQGRSAFRATRPFPTHGDNSNPNGLDLEGHKARIQAALPTIIPSAAVPLPKTTSPQFAMGGPVPNAPAVYPLAQPTPVGSMYAKVEVGVQHPLHQTYPALQGLPLVSGPAGTQGLLGPNAAVLSLLQQANFDTQPLITRGRTLQSALAMPPAVVPSPALSMAPLLGANTVQPQQLLSVGGGVSNDPLLEAMYTASIRNARRHNGALRQGLGTCGAVSPVDGYPFMLPQILARHDDAPNLTDHQMLLRNQIEVFEATEDDVTTHTRGRNKKIALGQVGVRCKHCKHLPILQRQKGSTYFPNSLLGIYQAAQNMNTVHMQCGLCTEMPEHVKQQFLQSLCHTHKVQHSGSGRQFWARSAKKLGLVDTEKDGIRFIRSIPQGAVLA